MKKENVKIIYCHDQNKNPIHYSKTVRGEKYYCIDCGSELIYKNGKVKAKHLSHKNTKDCGGTGESIFHKHWKENLFKAGMYIDIANKSDDPDNVEILDVLNEVSLKQRYNRQWDKDIVVDVLLITEKGDVVVEINYKNAKDWTEIKPYYDELDLLRVYEVTVGKSINDNLKWYSLGEEGFLSKRDFDKINKKAEKETRKFKHDWIKLETEKTQKRLKKAKQNKHIKTMLEDGIYKNINVIINYKTGLQQDYEIDDAITLKCLCEYQKGKYKEINLRFNTKAHSYSEGQVINTFVTKKGIKICSITIDTRCNNGRYEVVKFDKQHYHEYEKGLYIQLCKLGTTSR